MKEMVILYQQIMDKSKSKYFDIFDKFIEPVLTEFRRDIGHAAYIRNV